jgi:hypothetical protein
MGGWRKVLLLIIFIVELLAGEEGFEPSNAGIKIQCLNRLGDSPTQPFRLVPHFHRPWCRMQHNTHSLMRALDCAYSRCSSGCRASALAFHDLQRAGTDRSTSSAWRSCANAQNTHAPEPVILAFPNAPSQVMASAIGGNSPAATP